MKRYNIEHPETVAEESPTGQWVKYEPWMEAVEDQLNNNIPYWDNLLKNCDFKKTNEPISVYSGVCGPVIKCPQCQSFLRIGLPCCIYNYEKEIKCNQCLLNIKLQASGGIWEKIDFYPYKLKTATSELAAEEIKHEELTICVYCANCKIKNENGPITSYLCTVKKFDYVTGFYGIANCYQRNQGNCPDFKPKEP